MSPTVILNKYCNFIKKRQAIKGHPEVTNVSNSNRFFFCLFMFPLQEANLNLLEIATTQKLNSTNEWAYLQLGLHYLEQENYNKAIDSLRYIVRSQPKNSHFWETLGDAYFARGSYTSALKSYGKAVELSDEHLYSLLQIANIKLVNITTNNSLILIVLHLTRFQKLLKMLFFHFKLLQEYVDARKDFEEILSINKKYLPALKGLAETCLRQSEIYFTNQIYATSRDCAQLALDNVTA